MHAVDIMKLYPQDMQFTVIGEECDKYGAHVEAYWVISRELWKEIVYTATTARDYLSWSNMQFLLGMPVRIVKEDDVMELIMEVT